MSMHTITVAAAMFAVLSFAAIVTHRRRTARHRDRLRTEIYLQRAERSARQQKP